MNRILIALLLAASSLPMLGQGAPPQGGADQPYVMEYYYKVQWGHQQEFLQLFLKNHYPLLKKMVESGRMIIGQDRNARQPLARGCKVGLPGHDSIQELNPGYHREPFRGVPH